MIENVRLGGNHLLQRLLFAEEIRREYFDADVRTTRPDRMNRSRKLLRAPLEEIVAIDGGDHVLCACSDD
jgi:hypothetical protein